LKRHWLIAAPAYRASAAVAQSKSSGEPNVKTDAAASDNEVHADRAGSIRAAKTQNKKARTQSASGQFAQTGFNRASWKIQRF
jgi:hypothetical protein